jgi:ABC-type nitrate/sulfonate/bicarbonate transport system substrate-binding protein
MKRALYAIALAALLSGCGEITNTITAPAGSATPVTVELNGAPNATEVGMFYAQSLGYFSQADVAVH